MALYPVIRTIANSAANIILIVLAWRAVSGIGGLFRSHRQILVETGLLLPVHGVHIGCDIPGFLDR